LAFKNGVFKRKVKDLRRLKENEVNTCMKILVDKTSILHGMRILTIPISNEIF
jgi:hypothetical protein